MQTKNFQPNSDHKAFQNDLRAMGCLLTPESAAEIDHVFGASAKSNGVWIGQWAVIPLSDWWHRNGPFNRTNNRHEMNRVIASKMGRAAKKGLEKELLIWTWHRYLMCYRKPLPFDQRVIEAILIYPH